MTVAEQAAAMWTMAMHEAGHPEVSAYADSVVAYEDDPDNSVRFRFPDGLTVNRPNPLRDDYRHAWALVRARLG
ncbi:MAG TPA: hypothetical protein VGB14_16315 [Acidimicrobiales bacterium]